MASKPMRVLHLITARGGSKSIVRKNLQPIGELSLVGFKARAAQRSAHCARLIISTDDAEIQDEARRLGVEVPFTRPAELATDTASTDDVVQHAIGWVDAHEGPDAYDAVMLLEPSSPFARAEDLDGAVELMARTGANVVVGMREVEVASVFTGPMDDEGRITRIIDQMASLTGLRRQDQRQEYTMNGALYLMRWGYFREVGARYRDRDRTHGYPMDRFHSIEIDEPVDLEWARFLATTGRVNLQDWAPAPDGRRGTS
jgi:CMP-N,N'-diacetyllegionaminic acid synthase